jgi:hypothetical protein
MPSSSHLEERNALSNKLVTFPVPLLCPLQSHPLAWLRARVATETTQSPKRVTGTMRHVVQCANDSPDSVSGVAVHGMRVGVVEPSGQDGHAEALSEQEMSKAGYV